MKRGLSNTEVVISSGDRAVVTAVSKMDAANRVISGLRSAVEGAQLIVLDTPIGELRELLEAAGPFVESGAVVTDTLSVKSPVIRWAEECLPEDVSFVGGHPLLKKAPVSIEEADPAIFHGARYSVTPSETADETAVRTIVGLVEALGAKPIFLGQDEHDSYAAAMHHLPVVLSSAFVGATAGSDGWREMHRLAEAEFAAFGRHASNDPLDNEALCLAHPETLVHWIDQLILELYDYRNAIKDGGDDLVDKFVNVWELRAKWEADAVVPDDSVRLPTAGESIASAMLGDRLASRLGAMRNKEKEPETTYRFRRERR